MQDIVSVLSYRIEEVWQHRKEGKYPSDAGIGENSQEKPEDRAGE